MKQAEFQLHVIQSLQTLTNDVGKIKGHIDGLPKRVCDLEAVSATTKGLPPKVRAIELKVAALSGGVGLLTVAYAVIQLFKII